ncbi:unnamed protein product [Clavelina lepadiformis]|uniref:Uncharacterized protein n=1 Tax=Clavelina lepadiformis TaxID=159417 RepID=A0ABP0F4R5_CLALP
MARSAICGYTNSFEESCICAHFVNRCTRLFLTYRPHFLPDGVFLFQDVFFFRSGFDIRRYGSEIQHCNTATPPFPEFNRLMFGPLNGTFQKFSTLTYSWC